MLPLIIGLEGETLTASERDFIRAANPAGYILFGRNCRSPSQLRALTDHLREASGRERLPILVDQEGGRVSRLAPPAWPCFPATSRFGRLYARAPISAMEAARLNARAMAEILREAGITLNAFPLLDLHHDGADPVISDRAFAADPLWVSALGRASIDGMAAGGVGAVVKHLPGHGRSPLDSHDGRPIIDANPGDMEADLAPFRACRGAPFGMVAHIVYSGWDARRPASQSPVMIDMIRNEVGFEGLLMSDDIVMAALEGPLGTRAQGVLEAGCDLALVGRCDESERQCLAATIEPARPALRDRLDRALAIEAPAPANLSSLIAVRDALLAYA